MVSSGSNIEHGAVVRFQVLADTLEEPSVRVDLAIVSLLDGEHQIDSSSFQDIFFYAEVPGGHLENVEHVGRDVCCFHIGVHDVADILHLEVAISVLGHEALLDHDLLVKELLFSGELLERLRDLLITINNHEDQEVVFSEVGLL